MRRRSQKGNDQAEVNMTPMLDIVFILLIFFIVTSTFLQEQGYDMTPPPPSDEPPETDQSDPVILVQVDENNRVFVNSRATSEDRVLAAVQRIRAETPNSAVLIEPHDEALHGTVTLIWDDMRANSIPALIQRPDGSGN